MSLERRGRVFLACASFLLASILTARISLGSGFYGGGSGLNSTTVTGNASGANQVIQSTGANAASWTTLSAAIDAALGSTRGAILERGASGWTVLAPSSTAGQALASNGTAADPSYQALSANLNPTSSVISFPTGLGAVTQILGPTDQSLTIQPASNTTLFLKGNGRFIDIVDGNGHAVLTVTDNLTLGNDPIQMWSPVSFGSGLGSMTHITGPSDQSLNIAAASGEALQFFVGNTRYWYINFNGDLFNNAGAKAHFGEILTNSQDTTVSTQTTGSSIDASATVWLHNSSSAHTFTLPDATACSGRRYEIKDVGTGTLTVATTLSQSIDGGTSLTLTQYQSVTLVSDGTQWWIL